MKASLGLVLAFSAVCAHSASSTQNMRGIQKNLSSKLQQSGALRTQSSTRQLRGRKKNRRGNDNTDASTQEQDDLDESQFNRVSSGGDNKEMNSKKEAGTQNNKQKADQGKGKPTGNGGAKKTQGVTKEAQGNEKQTAPAGGNGGDKKNGPDTAQNGEDSGRKENKDEKQEPNPKTGGEARDKNIPDKDGFIDSIPVEQGLGSEEQNGTATKRPNWSTKNEMPAANQCEKSSECDSNCCVPYIKNLCMNRDVGGGYLGCLEG